MQANLIALDWNELLKFGDSAKFADWRLELEDDPEWILSLGDVGWDNDSASSYFMVGKALDKITEKLPIDHAERLKKSLMIIVCGNNSKTVRDFPCIPDSCYFISLSPATVTSIAENLGKLDKTIAQSLIVDALLIEYPKVTREAMDEEIKDYFTQIENLVTVASTRSWGIIGHMG